MTSLPMTMLSQANPIAEGSERRVYIDPTNDQRLIKVLRPGHEQQLGWNARGISMRLFRGVRTRDISKEYREYLRLALATMDHPAHLPIAHMYGFVPTDLGMGCLTQRVVSADGQHAPTLKDLYEQSLLTEDHMTALNSMARRMKDLHVRASDLKAANIVFGHRYYNGVKSDFEAVLVDGFGDIHAIPIRTWSKWANELALKERLEKIADRSGLTFDPAKWEFQL